jgi:hypothetical protein
MIYTISLNTMDECDYASYWVLWGGICEYWLILVNIG